MRIEQEKISLRKFKDCNLDKIMYNKLLLSNLFKFAFNPL